jgi:hypothetical protein
MRLGDIEAIRCDHDGLKMAEVQDGHLILRKKHHGQTHVKIVPLSAFAAEPPHPQPAEKSITPRPHEDPA